MRELIILIFGLIVCIQLCNGEENITTQQCEAHCDLPCKANAFCSEPDICACNPGYLAKDGVCEPVCSNKCPDKSHCVAPNTCSCPLEFEWDQSFEKCLPKCTPKCGLNSYCHKTDECKCRTGYEPNDLMSLSCHFSYPLWVYLIVVVLTPPLVGITYCCMATCGPHGVCISPETCGCNTGYRKNKKTQQCEAHCDLPCGANAFCSEPDICTCNRGYLAKDGVCEPVCSNKCPDKSHCVAPNTCSCPLEFEWDQSFEKCLPKCTPKCGLNSYCHKTNKCKCRTGYEPNDWMSLSCHFSHPWGFLENFRFRTVVAHVTTLLICYCYVLASTLTSLPS
ncbi:epidermal growth factor-like protein [Drosophila sulfurigaster albostrigata]|uniref:epidermal growth factor-like protein n=1 Tax=Drosophila sulfurigaster albostrigata TaxID=89887 RepID=UPI002D21AE6C|nr:epidermal growth factor-like protein [Drosophila sulfurigaster albostrigata]